MPGWLHYMDKMLFVLCFALFLFTALLLHADQQVSLESSRPSYKINGNRVFGVQFGLQVSRLTLMVFLISGQAFTCR